MTNKKITFRIDEHLDQLGYRHWMDIKGELQPIYKFHREVYEVGLKILDQEYKQKWISISDMKRLLLEKYR